MIRYCKCKVLNTRKSIVCGLCDIKLEHHEGARPVNSKYKEKARIEPIVNLVF